MEGRTDITLRDLTVWCSHMHRSTQASELGGLSVCRWEMGTAAAWEGELTRHTRTRVHAHTPVGGTWPQNTPVGDSGCESQHWRLSPSPTGTWKQPFPPRQPPRSNPPEPHCHLTSWGFAAPSYSSPQGKGRQVGRGVRRALRSCWQPKASPETPAACLFAGRRLGSFAELRLFREPGEPQSGLHQRNQCLR